MFVFSTCWQKYVKKYPEKQQYVLYILKISYLCTLYVTKKDNNAGKDNHKKSVILVGIVYGHGSYCYALATHRCVFALC